MDAQPAKRFVSVDVLRGFDMFWIIGGASLVTSLTKLFGGPAHEVISLHMDHVDWDGFHFMDLIFPLFVFLAGMSTVFSLGKILDVQGKWAAWKRLIKRCLLIYLMGLFYYGGLADGWEQMRFVGVLQRIAISSFFAGICFMYLGKRGLLITLAAILVGYYILSVFIPAPGQTQVGCSLEETWAFWVDKNFLIGRSGDWDPEGLLSGIPAIASGLLGVLAGMMMKDESLAHGKRLKHLLVWGVGCLVLGYVWSFHFPIIKVLWTSTFVLWAAGWSFLLLALFYWITDMIGWQKWAQPFIWIGMNSLTIYMTVAFVNFHGLANRLIGKDITGLIGDPWADFVRRAVQMALIFLFLRYLYKKKIFLRM